MAAYERSRPKQVKSLWIAYLLWWFGGPIGAHRFYLGAYQSGAAMAALLFGSFFTVLVRVPAAGAVMIIACLLWTFVDLFLIPGIRRRHAPPQPAENLANVFS